MVIVAMVKIVIKQEYGVISIKVKKVKGVIVYVKYYKQKIYPKEKEGRSDRN